MALSQQSHTGDGSTTAFAFNKGYIEQSHVKVYVDGALKTDPADYSWTTSEQITFVTAPAASADILFDRDTPNTARIVDYQDGGVASEKTLDKDSNQLFYIAQEIVDEAAAHLGLDAGTETKWDAESKIIENVATPASGSDAVTKDYADAIAAAAGNVPTPDNPGENDYILGASAGAFSWRTISDIITSFGAGAVRTALGLGALALKATVGTADIDDNAVTLAKMADLIRGKFIVGDASGDPATFGPLARGELISADVNGDPTAVAAGTEGEFLVAGASGDPVFRGRGGWVLHSDGLVDLTNGGANDLNNHRFSSIPSWVREVELHFQTIGHSDTVGSQAFHVRFGTGTDETSGYSGRTTQDAGTPKQWSTTTTVPLTLAVSDTLAFNGTMRAVSFDASEWNVQVGSAANSDGPFYGSGVKTMTGTFSSINIFVENNKLFDVGTCYLLYR